MSFRAPVPPPGTLRPPVVLAVLLAGLGAACCAERDPAPFPRVHRVAGGASEVYANAYIVEGRAGVVVIDALLTRPASRDLRRRVEATGKPLRAVILTHGHPDHYGGVAQLVEGLTGVPVLALPGVDAVIRRDDAAKGERLAALGIDWAPVRRFPDRAAAAGEALSFGEFTLTALDFGAGESDHDSAWVLDCPSGQFVFAGDLVMNEVHAYAADAHTGAWLASLARLRQAFVPATRLYPGHGPPGDGRLWVVQAAYIERLRAEIVDLARGRPELGDSETRELERRMIDHVGHDRMARWIQEAADPVAAELAMQMATRPED